MPPEKQILAAKVRLQPDRKTEPGSPLNASGWALKKKALEKRRAAILAKRRKIYALQSKKTRVASSAPAANPKTIQWVGYVVSKTKTTIKAMFTDTDGGPNQLLEFPFKQLQPAAARLKVREGSMLTCRFEYDKGSENGLNPDSLEIKLVQSKSSVQKTAASAALSYSAVK